MAVKITFYLTSSGRSPVEKYIESLPKEDQGKFADVIKGVQKYGFEFEPVEFKHLRGKLWEIKFRARGGGYRVIYVVVEKDLMLWLHAIKKDSQKTPPEDLDLDLAERRMKEVL
jgi:phage-related protein